LKAIAVYRNGSKRSQPLNTSDAKKEKAHKSEAGTEEAGEVSAVSVEGKPFRHKLSDERRAITHKFRWAATKAT